MLLVALSGVLRSGVLRSGVLLSGVLRSGVLLLLLSVGRSVTSSPIHPAVRLCPNQTKSKQHGPVAARVLLASCGAWHGHAG